MQANTFTEKWIDLDNEVPDFGNDPCIPVMVQRIEDGSILTIKSIDIERHEPGGYTVWIKVEDY